MLDGEGVNDGDVVEVDVEVGLIVNVGDNVDDIEALGDGVGVGVGDGVTLTLVEGVGVYLNKKNEICGRWCLGW